MARAVSSRRGQPLPNPSHRPRSLPRTSALRAVHVLQPNRPAVGRYAVGEVPSLQSSAPDPQLSLYRSAIYFPLYFLLFCGRCAATEAAAARRSHSALKMCSNPQNVMRRVKDEQTRTDRLVDIKAVNGSMVRCQWEASRMRTDPMTRQRFTDKEVANEIEQGNKELILLRRARMKEFLEAEAAEFEANLNARGLAFAKHRP